MKKFKVGLQLYSIREDMAKDMDSALREVKRIGYDYVEFAGFFEKTADEIKALLDKNGLFCESVHQGYDSLMEGPQSIADYYQVIGAKYCVIPGIRRDNHKGSESFDKIVGELIKAGKLLRDNGISMLYHNHDFEFEQFEGKYLLDWLYETITSDILGTQLDTCWIRYAGEDPIKYIEKYAGRADIIHLKDFVCTKEMKTQNTKEENGFEFRPLGDGIQDIPAILSVAEKAGAEYVIVEQDSPTTMTAMESAKRSREYLKSLGI